VECLVDWYKINILVVSFGIRRKTFEIKFRFLFFGAIKSSILMASKKFWKIKWWKCALIISHPTHKNSKQNLHAKIPLPLIFKTNHNSPI